jgi:hypothetical protein
MITYFRHTLLMVTALLSHMTPPHRPPGHDLRAVKPVRTVPCEDRDCTGNGRWQRGFVYLCSSCDQSFNYCTACESYFPDGEEDKHKNSAA